MSFEWWNALNHGGLLISPDRLGEFYREASESLPGWLAEKLRKQLFRFQNAAKGEIPGQLSALVEFVLTEIAFLRTGWLTGRSVDAETWSVKLSTGETVRPRRVWQDGNGTVLPVFVEDPQAIRRIGQGRGRRSTAAAIEWLRRKAEPIALVTNGRQWRLIYAGPDFDAWCEWDTAAWFDAGLLGPQVEAFRTLLGEFSLTPRRRGEACRLVEAVRATRRGQSELSDALGERVRLAVERLIAACSEKLPALLEGECSVEPAAIYQAATRMVMRLVVVLFAEARGLLDRQNELYENSYGLNGLRSQLYRERAQARDSLRFRQYAWPRILGLGRMIYEGSGHPRFILPQYGGALFKPSDPQSPDPVLRALAAFESVEGCPSDAVVVEILRLISEAPVKNVGPMPVDFSSLSTEYIGILYEGLLDYELRRADETTVFLNVGSEPVLPLARLESFDDARLKSLLGEFDKKQKADSGDQEDGGDREDQEAEQEADAEAEIAEEEPDAGEAASEYPDGERERADAWAKRAARLASSTRKSSGRGGESAKPLIRRVVLPGEWYLVRWGGTRKGQGAYYTRPGLCAPTTQRTLAPLIYEDADPAFPKLPERILEVKVCDPAMGSGAFLVAALRVIVSALFDSLFEHGWIERFSDETGVERLRADAVNRPDWFADVTKGLDATAEEAEERLRARLKRVVVEHCIYGVDFDPLATELAKMALWIETMDRELPFGFLDHKLKHGNSLIGAWFDQFVDYPVLALERVAGDRDHKGVHVHAGIGEAQLKAAKAKLKELMASSFTGQRTSEDTDEEFARRTVLDRDYVLDAVQQLHRMSIRDVSQRAESYARALSYKGVQNLRLRLDGWCALWFWPEDRLDCMPTPAQLVRNIWSDEAARVLRDVTGRYRFFHWELEFPDVFDEAGAGFSAIVGNPPWEIQKPNSKEFFSNIDPIYRGYGKQEALVRQGELFRSDASIERAWLDYVASFKARINYFAHAAHPFGDQSVEGAANFSPFRGSGSKTANASFHARWAARRQKRKGYADPVHPFRHQGSADVNTYKLFLEKAHALIAPGGRLGMIAPSGLYSDEGSIGLRRLFLDKCRWAELFGFENREGIFKIHRSFKFCTVLLWKGGKTASLRTAFMRRKLADWERPDDFFLEYPRELVTRFSPSSLALLEIGSLRDIEILEKIYSKSVLLGAQGPGTWGIKYTTEFHMTNDAKKGLFRPREWWEARGYAPDEYGRWIGPDGDMALPLYEGRMIGQFDFSEKGWVSGKGRAAKWREIPWERKVIEPQFLMSSEIFESAADRHGRRRSPPGLKLGFMDVGSATNARTVISSLINECPCGNKVPILTSIVDQGSFSLLAVLNSFAFDFQMRRRLAGTTLNEFIIAEAGLPSPSGVTVSVGGLAKSLATCSETFAAVWLRTRPEADMRPWRALWALTHHERLRVRCNLEATVAALYGFSEVDLRWILSECHFPRQALADDEFCRGLNPRGFWRVDKDQDPELRHTVLTLAAFRDLQTSLQRHGLERGIEGFCAQNDGEGWMIPETLDLEELVPEGPLALDPAGSIFEAAPKGSRPVRSRLGPRLYDWQLEQGVEESWAECEYHARRILGEEGFADLMRKIESGEDGAPEIPSSTVDLTSPQPALFDALQPALADAMEDA